MNFDFFLFLDYSFIDFKNWRQEMIILVYKLFSIDIIGRRNKEKIVV